MNLKSKTYMRNAEFRIRQFWLPFVDAVGIVLKELEELKERTWNWYKGWNRKSTKKHFINLTPPLNFEPMSHREWQRKAKQLKLYLGMTQYIGEFLNTLSLDENQNFIARVTNSIREVKS